jgi:hypothetical protein
MPPVGVRAVIYIFFHVIVTLKYMRPRYAWRMKVSFRLTLLAITLFDKTELDY